MPVNDNDIELHREEVNEILTATPKWILRWGISVVFLLIVLGVVLSYFIKYPDILKADVTVTTLHPPVSLVAKTTGQLTHVLVKEKQFVKKGEIIAVIENTANYKDVLILMAQAEEVLSSLKTKDTAWVLQLKDGLNVGNLTPYYLQTLKAIKDLYLYTSINPNTRQITLLKRDLGAYASLVSKYQMQQTINDEQLKLAEADYNRDKRLFEDKTISAREFETKKREYLAALSSSEQLKITTSNASIQLNNVEKSILQLQIQDYQEQAKIKAELTQQIKTLLAEVYKWKAMYLVESPVEGKVSFFNVWAVNQQVNMGDALFSVIPKQDQQFIGKCTLPVLNSGKLAVGQLVNIKLDNYSYTEYGMLVGEVSNIAEVPNSEVFAVDVVFKHGLKTSYNNVLPYKEQMKGKAEVVTQNNTVLERIFFNFKKLVARN